MAAVDVVDDRGIVDAWFAVEVDVTTTGQVKNTGPIRGDTIESHVREISGDVDPAVVLQLEHHKFEDILDKVDEKTFFEREDDEQAFTPKEFNELYDQFSELASFYSSALRDLKIVYNV